MSKNILTPKQIARIKWAKKMEAESRANFIKYSDPRWSELADKWKEIAQDTLQTVLEFD
jgi:hypothetical protein